MKKFGKVLPILIFFLMIYGIAGVGIVQEDRGYSSSENRMLQKFPKLNKKRIMNGKFQKKYEVYLSDQFPSRDAWIQVKTRAERLAGKTESNGVYFGKQGYLLEKYTKADFDEEQVEKNIQALKTFVEGLMPAEEEVLSEAEKKKEAKKKQETDKKKGKNKKKKDKEKKSGSANASSVDVKVMMVPSKTDILREYLPAFAQSYEEDSFYQRLEEALPEGTLVPVKDTLLEHTEEDIYYKNDHHWTMLGAWYGYEAYRKACGELTEETKAEQKKQAIKTVSTNFLGTTYSKVNMYTEMDELSIYEPEGEFSVVYNMGEKTEDTFYQWSYLEEKDQYSVFSGGNQAVLEITGGEKNGKTLMIVKDSFANSMIPFLMEDYEKIVVVDMRQLNVGLSMITRMYQPTDVLVLYNMVQFMQDRDFAIKP